MKLEITAEEFTSMYLELTNQEISEKLGISVFIINRYAKALGLQKKLGRPFKKYEFDK